jgi:hypothetical protein
VFGDMSLLQDELEAPSPSKPVPGTRVAKTWAPVHGKVTESPGVMSVGNRSGVTPKSSTAPASSSGQGRYRDDRLCSRSTRPVRRVGEA